MKEKGFNILHNFLSLLFGKSWLQPSAHNHLRFLTYQSRGKGEKQAAAGGNTGASLSLSAPWHGPQGKVDEVNHPAPPMTDSVSLANCSTWVNKFIKPFNWKESFLEINFFTRYRLQRYFYNICMWQSDSKWHWSITCKRDQVRIFRLCQVQQHF